MEKFSKLKIRPFRTSFSLMQNNKQTSCNTGRGAMAKKKLLKYSPFWQVSSLSAHFSGSSGAHGVVAILINFFFKIIPIYKSDYKDH